MRAGGDIVTQIVVTTQGARRVIVFLASVCGEYFSLSDTAGAVSRGVAVFVQMAAGTVGEDARPGDDMDDAAVVR